MSDVKFISIRGAADLADQLGYEIKRMADEVEK